jgi:hypothetical protein
LRARMAGDCNCARGYAITMHVLVARASSASTKLKLVPASTALAAFEFEFGRGACVCNDPDQLKNYMYS